MLTTRSRFRVLSEIAQENEEEGVSEAKKEKRRKKITKELFETEKTYLTHLELVNKHFDFPLRFNCLIPDDIHAKIFGNIEQIWEVNKTLLEYMEQTTIGQAFHYLGPFLKLYSTYANNHENALSALQEWQQKCSDFKDFIVQQEDRPDIQGLKLNALLITPVQRIPRYKLLLEDLLEYTSEEHHDYDKIKESAEQIGQIASHINEHIKQHENFQKMLSIQKSFDRSAPKILAPGREFLREGVLKKVSRKGGKSHDRMFFLFSDMMIYGKPKFLDGGNNSYSCCCVLPLKHCQVEKLFGNNRQYTETGGMFNITCKDESLLLMSHDPQNVSQWIETLEAAIKKLNTNRSTLRKPSSNKLPMRGKSLWRQKKQEKLEDKKMKAKLQPVQETTTPTCEELSPCLPDGLSPFKKNFPSLTKCMSPSKKRKLENEPNSTPHPPPRTRRKGVTSMPIETYNSSPLPRRMTRRPLSVTSENSQYSEVFDDTNTWNLTASQSLDYTENTFMQVTMEDIDIADISQNSFCQPREEEKSSTGVYYTNSYHENKTQTCSGQPMNRMLNHGRSFTKRCQSAINSVQNRISETKQSCSIQ